QLAGLYTGLACEDGLYFDGRRIHGDDSANWQQGRRVLLHRTVQAGIIQSTGLSILTEGLSYDRCQVGVVTDVDLALRYPDLDILEEDQLFSVFRSQVDVVLADGAAVLNIDQPFIARMAELCDGEIIFFSAQAQPDTVLQQHVQGGGRAVLLKEGRRLVMQHASQDSSVGPLPAWADTLSDRTAVLAGVATAWALGVDKDVVRTALQTFHGQSPAIGASAVMPAAAAV